MGLPGPPRSGWRLTLRLLSTLILGGVGWVVLGYLAMMPLGMVFGWSGHPAIPAAPMVVYVMLYAVMLPGLCLLAGWKASRWLE